MCAPCSPIRRCASTTIAGTSTRTPPAITRITPKLWSGARPRCTPSKPARASWPNWLTWWPMRLSKPPLATMLRLDVEYDVLPRESEILHLDFWAAAFELLKQRKAIYFENEGKHAGCWVMPGLSEDI